MSNIFARVITTDPAATTAAESAPTTTEGVDVTNKSKVLVQVHTLTDTPTYSIKAWIKVGSKWTEVNNGAFTGKTTTFCELFEVKGADRFFLQISALTGGAAKAVTRTYTATR